MSKQNAILDDDFVAFRVRYEMKRQARGMRELARELGMKPSYLHRRVHGEVPFSAVELAKTAEILGVEIGVFFPPADVDRTASAGRAA